MGGPDQDGFAENLLGLENNGHPRDFFKRLANPKRKALELFNSEPDLSLSLSLGACYSEVPKEKPLLRSSSLAGVPTLNENDGEFLSLARSSSLPTEAGHEQKTIRELQSMKKIAASRMLLDKNQQGRGGSQPQKSPLETVTPPQLATWAAESAARNGAFCRAIGKIKSKFNAPTTISVQGENSSANSSAGAGAPHFHPLFTFKAMVENGKAVKPATSQPVPMGMFGTMANGKAAMPAESELKNLYKRIKAHKSSKQGNGRAGMEMMMRQMPSVTTIGEGPNGRKIEGFLYNYMKGQVSIVCVCHGNFFTPAEFVRHAGGRDVVNPMKHINVLPFSF